MLEVSGLVSGYGRISILRDVELRVEPGRVVIIALLAARLLVGLRLQQLLGVLLVGGELAWAHRAAQLLPALVARRL